MKTNKLQESQLRSLVRNEISKIIKERQDEVPDKEKAVDRETTKEKEPEEDRSTLLKKVTGSYLRSLKANLGDLTANEVVDAVDSLMTNLNFGKENKVNVIRGLRGRVQA